MIDWYAQWEQFAPGFQEGVLPVSVGATTLKLIPGPGFGDLSHPTTQLMVEAIPKMVAHRSVVDIGCGSGILSLVAMASGASSVIGIDIDPQACAHAALNAKKNHMECAFYTVEQSPSLPEEGVLLMNMITQEQTKAWKTIPYHNVDGPLLVSGVLKEEKEQSITTWQRRGYKLDFLVERQGWLLLQLYPTN